MSTDPRPPREIAFDCKFFLGDRPCVWHKREGVLCTCDHYERVDQRLLIIKLDAMGDVLRSTALLPGISEAHPGAAITWLTRRESTPLLARNRFLADVWALDADTIARLSVQSFDRVINLDASQVSAALASVARAPRKDGFVLDERGIIRPTNDRAREWLEAGVFDDIKRQGTATYQDRMAAILGLEGKRHYYVLDLDPDEIQRGRMQLVSTGVDPSRPIVGLNHGAGGRWPLKQWREDGYRDLIERLTRRTDAQLVLLGGPSERERTATLLNTERARVFDAGSDNSLRQFAAIVDHCDVVVTGDTLAMHMALARNKRTVVLFGPTSAAEIELYGLGEKILPDMACLSCYKTACDFVPNCMDLISATDVEAAVLRQLEIARPSLAGRM